MIRAILATVIACVVIALGSVQFASDALFRNPGSAFGLGVYRALDGVAPVAFVSDTLATTALARGDLDAAQRYVVQMPPGERRDDLLARIAAAHGDAVLARKYYFAATDVAAMQEAIAELARTNVNDALAEEAQFRDHLIALGTHPDAVAESYYLSAKYEASEGHYAAALPFDQHAVALAPMNQDYLLLAGAHAYFDNDLADAQRYFARGVAVNPGNGDAIAGLGLVALRRGDRSGALAYLARARAVDPRAPTVASLAAALR